MTDTVKYLNGRNKVTSITCYDFSTLHANIAPGKLIRILNERIDFCFKDGGGNSTELNKYGAQWINRKVTGAIKFTQTSLEKSVNYLGNKFFK